VLRREIRRVDPSRPCHSGQFRGHARRLSSWYSCTL
jgi:hypothetical protein